jgi:hypothetical protein
MYSVLDVMVSRNYVSTNSVSMASQNIEIEMHVLDTNAGKQLSCDAADV